MEERNYDSSTNNILRDQSVTIYTQLHICHGSALILHVLRCLLSSMYVGEPFLSRNVLEALGLEYKKVLRAAGDHQEVSADVSALVENQPNFGTGYIVLVIDGVFHAECGANDVDLMIMTVGWKSGPETK